MSKPEISGIAPFFIVRNVPAALSVKDDDGDGLYGFEVKDADGYLLFFGRRR